MRTFWATLLALTLLFGASPASAYGVARDYRHNQVASNATPGAGHGSGWQGFSPTWIPGAFLWLSASSGATTGATFTWSDRIGTASFTQGTGSKQPTPATSGGGRVLSFASASAQELNSAAPVVLPQPVVVFTVAQSTSGAGQQQPYGDNPASIAAPFWTGSAWDSYAGSTLAGNASRSLQSFICVVNGTNSALYINSSQVPLAAGSNGTNTLSGTLHIGSSSGTNYLNGVIGELVFATVVPDSSLRWRWMVWSANRFSGAWQ